MISNRMERAIHIFNILIRINNKIALIKYSKLNMSKYEGIWKNNITKNQYVNIMGSVHRQLDRIVDDYDNFMMSEDDGF